MSLLLRKPPSARAAMDVYKSRETSPPPLSHGGNATGAAGAAEDGDDSETNRGRISATFTSRNMRHLQELADRKAEQQAAEEAALVRKARNREALREHVLSECGSGGRRSRGPGEGGGRDGGGGGDDTAQETSGASGYGGSDGDGGREVRGQVTGGGSGGSGCSGGSGGDGSGGGGGVGGNPTRSSASPQRPNPPGGSRPSTTTRGASRSLHLRASSPASLSSATEGVAEGHWARGGSVTPQMGRGRDATAARTSDPAFVGAPKGSPLSAAAARASLTAPPPPSPYSAGGAKLGGAAAEKPVWLKPADPRDPRHPDSPRDTSGSGGGSGGFAQRGRFLDNWTREFAAWRARHRVAEGRKVRAYSCPLFCST